MPSLKDELIQKVMNTEFCFHRQCTDCQKKEIRQVVPMAQLQNLPPFFAFVQGSPLNVMMHAMNIPDSQDENTIHEVLVMHRCQDEMCLMRLHHEMMCQGVVQKIQDNVQTIKKFASKDANRPATKKDKKSRKRRGRKGW